MINTSNLIRRVNRKLRANGEQVHKAHSLRTNFDLGEFYVRDFERGTIVATNVDLEDLARELGVLNSSERADV